jgi:alkylation response protein AidB-like acyl-CoA dehydrogenase
MRFALSAEQRQFGTALHDLLTAADVPAAARAWAAGEPGPGLVIWRALASAGVTGLMVPQACDGLGAQPVDLVVACEELGHHPVPGPIAESVAAVPVLLSELDVLSAELTDLAGGGLIATLARPPLLPYALDAEVAGLVLLAEGGQVWRALPDVAVRSMDPARRLSGLRPGQLIAGQAETAIGTATSYGTLASAALLIGAGRGLLEMSVNHAKTRHQFGRPIGSFQTIKHRLADVLIAIEFARPLLYAAAVRLGADAATAARDLSAARIACADAARLAARVALQVHGAIGYTRECDVSLWLAKVRALSSIWGSQAEHRAVVLAALTEPETGPWS